jgi:hypothetical protein
MRALNAGVSVKDLMVNPSELSFQSQTGGQNHHRCKQSGGAQYLEHALFRTGRSQQPKFNDDHKEWQSDQSHK